MTMIIFRRYAFIRHINNDHGNIITLIFISFVGGYKASLLFSYYGECFWKAIFMSYNITCKKCVVEKYIP